MTNIRLLPVVIVSAALLLGVKIGNIWLGLEPMFEVSVATAKAASKDGEEKAAEGGEDAQAKGETTVAPAGKKSPVDDKGATDPANFSKAEIEVLQNLGQRRQELEQRARELDMRENLLSATEKRVDNKIGELKKIEATVKSLLRQHDEQEEEQMKSLVKVYEKMKPKDAARILERLDMEVLIDVTERMKEAKMAAVMAEMDAAKAKALTMELATRRKLPQAKMDGGEG
jgi:flagellar motility protein MotE (MotC chaperone)